MANLYLTHKCNRGCPFCFARKALKEAGSYDEIMTLDEIDRFIRKYRQELPIIGLLGGEPFLYPHLPEAVKLIRGYGIPVKIFTSATNPVPEGFEEVAINDPGVNFVVNVGEASSYNERQARCLEEFMQKFHAVSALSYTIFDLNTDPSYLFDLINRYGLLREIRTGIALPIYKGGNSFIALKDYKAAGRYFIECARKAAAHRIAMSMDCGFIACMFDDAQIGELLKLGSRIGFMCGAATDVGPGLIGWNCFPLFQLGKINVMEADSMKDLCRKFDEKLAEHMDASRGVLPECESCEKLADGLCQGGCRSFKSF